MNRCTLKSILSESEIKFKNVVGQMRRVLKNEWGMRKRTVARVVHKDLFVACVMYGSNVWCEYMRYKYARDIMNRYQRIVLHACLNVCKIVSTDAMQARFLGTWSV